MKHANIINKLTLKEKAMLMSGKNTWQTWSFEDKGVPSIFLSDGPHGIRKQAGSADHLGINESIPATSFPTAATLANSWDIDLLEKVGQALGKESVELGVNVLLGPGMNIKRSPLGGRNFEYFSEDPVLTGELASAMVKGIQASGIAASPKHFAANSQELRRMSVDSVLDERTFREIYLQAFEIVVKQSHPKFMMTAYNPINGIHANEHQHLLQDILYGEWDYQGVLVTDWGGSNDHVEAVKQGSHLEMPSTGLVGARELISAVETGQLDQKVLDQRVDELLDVTLSIQIDEPTSNKLSEQTIEVHDDLAFQAAKESMVLLKNTSNILPIQSNEAIAFIGDFAEQPRYQGAGSSKVNPTRMQTILDIKGAYGWEDVPFAKGYHRNGQLDDKLIQEALKLAKTVDKVVVFMGLTEVAESEGVDRTHLNLEKNQLALIEALVQAKLKIIIVLSGGAVVELPFADDVLAIMHSYLNGQAGARAILEVLKGLHNPSGKLNESYPLVYEDVPNQKYYPGLEKTAEYRDGLFVGYRYYQTAKKAVRYPFGHGLSYTTFAYESVKINQEEIIFNISNTGAMIGAEVVQVYAGLESSEIFRPAKELIGFAKVKLTPGETQTLSIKFSQHAFEFFNPILNKWETEAGNYTIELASSSQTTHITSNLEIAGVTADGIYEPEELLPYYVGSVQDIDLNTFEALLGRTVPESHWNKQLPLDKNDSISQLYYSKSFIGRLIYKVLNKLIDRSVKKGEPNLNLYFNYNLTFRAIQKMTLGKINHIMVNDILTIVNGKTSKGLASFVKHYLENTRLNKGGKTNGR